MSAMQLSIKLKLSCLRANRLYVREKEGGCHEAARSRERGGGEAAFGRQHHRVLPQLGLGLPEILPRCGWALAAAGGAGGGGGRAISDPSGPRQATERVEPES